MAGVDDFANVGRLEEEQINALKNTEEALEKWDKFHNDYTALQDRLKTLPDKVTHEVMVPFGPMAFMPGQLRHTNEILVLLGDNWFVERSAKQACEIVERRLKAVNQQMADLKSQQKLLLSRRDFTSVFRDESQSQEGVFEIKEEYDPEQEKLWKEHHRMNVRLHRKKVKEGASQGAAGVQKPVEYSDEDLWRRLDELELEEKANRELERLPDTPDTSSTFIPSSFNVTGDRQRDSTDSGKKVRWKDEAASDASTNSNGSGYEEDSEASSVEHSDSKSRTIKIQHTPISDVGKDSSPTEDESTSDIKSPADIYKYFGSVSSQKSILKEPSSIFPSQDTKPPDVKEKIIVPGSASAFSGTIVEKATSATPVVSDSLKATDTGPPKRVSKFKAQRQQMQR
ncbi:unconventional prefoldin RPB5 interactor-like [Lineus longissimus]|uniref:unconventional prefoldin RPB5 interactor-like n=1 Tax=Lineus longissimus TaxID=88925 RepID=UPI002B4C7427